MSESFGIHLARPLRQLLWMQSKGKIRRTLQRLRSPRRAIPTVLVGILMLLYVVQIYIAIAFNSTETSIPIRSIAPLGMFSILCLKLLGVCIDRNKSGAGYRSEEVHCLLGGPFPQQQVRLFRVTGHAVSIFFTSIFAAIFFRFHVESFTASLTGSYLAMLFTYLIYSTIAVVAVNVNQRAYRMVRNVVCGAAVAVLAYILYQVALLDVRNLAFLKAFGEEAIRLSETQAGQVLMAPFLIFTNVIVAESPREWALWMLPALAIDYLSLQLLMRLEVQFERWSTLREQSEFVANQNRLVSPAARRAAVDIQRIGKKVVWLAGAGPIIWRQMRGLSRLQGGLGWLLIPLALAFGVGGFMAYDPDQGAIQTMAVIVVLTSVFLPGLLPFDFRGDLKGLAALKMMPLRSVSVVMGQLFVPVMLLTTFQFFALSSLLLHDATLVNSILLTVCFLIPTNTIIMALENLVFLLYPYRVAEFDMQATVRRIVMLMAKFCVVFLAVLISLLAGLGVLGLKMAVGWSSTLTEFLVAMRWPLLISTQLAALTFVAALVVRSTCWAYTRFDLSEDLPA